MSHRSVAALTAGSAMLLCSLAACSSSNQGTAGTSPVNSVAGSRISIAMVTHGQAFDPFWALVKKGAEQAAADFNVELSYSSPSTTDPQAQATLISQAAAKRPAALVVTIPDQAVLGPPVRQVASSGTPVVVVNVGDGVYKSDGALTYVGQADYVAGQEAGRTMVAAGVRKALCVIFEAQNIALTDRCAGFTTQLAASGGSVQTLHVNGAQLNEAQSSIEQALKASPDVNGVLATGIIGFQAAGGALQSLNLFGKVKFGTFDVSAAGLTAVQNGQLMFVIDQQPFLEGYDAIQVAAFEVRYGQHPYQPIYTGPSFITKANVDRIAELYHNTGIPLFQGGYPQ